ncbi:hypothetical protein BU23DRAFT_3121 [Bimuria novae-zelandiae CBS 107.79]|uniref:F-box domain-containing protein n=1 Tax=Bimuria novae-zelandiae CBS 107.79 TaxID=1447943 RepID=A0A6A5VR32_9PLEO|nr:hypothetical protein BU23DRAFT_3121 [Bimuria novae-zelandiae CBS 107.79]
MSWPFVEKPSSTLQPNSDFNLQDFPEEILLQIVSQLKAKSTPKTQRHYDNTGPTFIVDTSRWKHRRYLRYHIENDQRLEALRALCLTSKTLRRIAKPILDASFTNYEENLSVGMVGAVRLGHLTVPPGSLFFIVQNGRGVDS